MKYLLGICLIFLFGPSYSQEDIYQVDFYREPLDKALQHIEQTYDFRFSYDPELISTEYLTVNIREKKPQKFIEILLDAIPFNSRKSRDVILLLPEKRIVSRRLSGRVRDADDGSPLAFAVIQTTGGGFVADPGGEFSIDIPRDSVLLTITYLGYRSKEIIIGHKVNAVNVKLKPNDNQLPEFIIDANRQGNHKIAGYTSVNPGQISTLPSLGETDVFKSLQLLPGITATDESASGLTIRGGSPDQNLVLLDGFTIYHLDHFFGIFSTFNPHTINHVDVYKGGFDARYGGRVSAVVDAKARAWADEKLSGGFGINGSSVSGFLQTAVGEKLFLNVGARLSHYNLVRNPLYNQFIDKNRLDAINADNPTFSEIRSKIRLEPQFSFYDLNAKLRYAPNNSETFDINLYLSDDTYSGTRGIDFGISFFEVLDNADWSNGGLSANWFRDWNNRFSSELTISGSSYEGSSTLQNQETFDDALDLSLAGDFQEVNDNTIVYQNYRKSNVISDMSLKWHHDYELNSFHDFSFGTELKIINTRFAISLPDRGNNVSDINGSVNSLYFSDSYKKDRLGMTAGLRYNYISNSDKHFLEPRYNISYDLSDNIMVFGNYSFHNQFVNRVSISPFGNSDQFYWVLADDEEYPVIRGRHMILGASYQADEWLIEAEAYRRSADGILESRFALESSFNGLEKPDDDELLLPSGSNITTGIDLLVKRKTDKYVSWVSYTLSKSENTFELLNEGRPFAANFDQRHELNWVNIYKRGKWEFSSVFIYGSGRPYTTRGEVSSAKIILFDVTRFNAFRIRDYHRLDISAKYITGFKKMKLETGLTLFNIYNRENVKSRRFSLRYNLNDEKDQITSVTAFPLETSLLGFVPNLFIYLSF